MRHKNHTLHYIDLHPEPLATERAPSAGQVIAGAAVTLAAVWLMACVLFTL